MYLFVLSGLYLVRASSSRRNRRVLYFLCLVFLFIFSAFRFEVGCDWLGYLSHFNIYSNLNFSEVLDFSEPLWVSLFVFIGTLELSYPWINVASSFIFFMGANALAKRQSDPLAFLIFLFPVLILNLPMSGIRQASALGFLFFSFIYFSEKSAFKFCLAVFIATAFHSSAVIFILFLPFVKGGFSRNRVVISFFLAAPGLFFIAGSSHVEEASFRYISSDVVASGAKFRVGALVITSLYFFVFLRKKWLVLFPQDYKLVALFSFIMLLLGFFLPVSSVIADRVGYYFFPIQAMIFARIPFLGLQGSWKFHFVWPYVFLFFLLLFWSLLSSHFSMCYIPYRTWFFGFPELLP